MGTNRVRWEMLVGKLNSKGGGGWQLSNMVPNVRIPNNTNTGADG